MSIKNLYNLLDKAKYSFSYGISFPNSQIYTLNDAVNSLSYSTSGLDIKNGQEAIFPLLETRKVKKLNVPSRYSYKDLQTYKIYAPYRFNAFTKPRKNYSKLTDKDNSYNPSESFTSYLQKEIKNKSNEKRGPQYRPLYAFKKGRLLEGKKKSNSDVSRKSDGRLHKLARKNKLMWPPLYKYKLEQKLKSKREDVQPKTEQTNLVMLQPLYSYKKCPEGTNKETIRDLSIYKEGLERNRSIDMNSLYVQAQNEKHETLTLPKPKEGGFPLQIEKNPVMTQHNGIPKGFSVDALKKKIQLHKHIKTNERVDSIKHLSLQITALKSLSGSTMIQRYLLNTLDRELNALKATDPGMYEMFVGQYPDISSMAPKHQMTLPPKKQLKYNITAIIPKSNLISNVIKAEKIKENKDSKDKLSNSSGSGGGGNGSVGRGNGSGSGGGNDSGGSPLKGNNNSQGGETMTHVDNLKEELKTKISLSRKDELNKKQDNKDSNTKEIQKNIKWAQALRHDTKILTHNLQLKGGVDQTTSGLPADKEHQIFKAPSITDVASKRYFSKLSYKPRNISVRFISTNFTKWNKNPPNSLTEPAGIRPIAKQKINQLYQSPLLRHPNDGTLELIANDYPKLVRKKSTYKGIEMTRPLNKSHVTNYVSSRTYKLPVDKSKKKNEKPSPIKEKLFKKTENIDFTSNPLSAGHSIEEEIKATKSKNCLNSTTQLLPSNKKSLKKGKLSIKQSVESWRKSRGKISTKPISEIRKEVSKTLRKLQKNELKTKGQELNEELRKIRKLNEKSKAARGLMNNPHNNHHYQMQLNKLQGKFGYNPQIRTYSTMSNPDNIEIEEDFSLESPQDNVSFNNFAYKPLYEYKGAGKKNASLISVNQTPKAAKQPEAKRDFSKTLSSHGEKINKWKKVSLSIVGIDEQVKYFITQSKLQRSLKMKRGEAITSNALKANKENVTAIQSTETEPTPLAADTKKEDSAKTRKEVMELKKMISEKIGKNNIKNAKQKKTETFLNEKNHMKKDTLSPNSALNFVTSGSPSNQTPKLRSYSQLGMTSPNNCDVYSRIKKLNSKLSKSKVEKVFKQEKPKLEDPLKVEKLQTDDQLKLECQSELEKVNADRYLKLEKQKVNDHSKLEKVTAEVLSKVEKSKKEEQQLKEEKKVIKDHPSDTETEEKKSFKINCNQDGNLNNIKPARAIIDEKKEHNPRHYYQTTDESNNFSFDKTKCITPLLEANNTNNRFPLSYDKVSKPKIYACAKVREISHPIQCSECKIEKSVRQEQENLMFKDEDIFKNKKKVSSLENSYDSVESVKSLIEELYNVSKSEIGNFSLTKGEYVDKINKIFKKLSLLLEPSKITAQLEDQNSNLAKYPNVYDYRYISKSSKLYDENTRRINTFKYPNIHDLRDVWDKESKTATYYSESFPKIHLDKAWRNNQVQLMHSTTQSFGEIMCPLPQTNGNFPVPTNLKLSDKQNVASFSGPQTTNLVVPKELKLLATKIENVNPSEIGNMKIGKGHVIQSISIAGFIDATDLSPNISSSNSMEVASAKNEKSKNNNEVQDINLYPSEEYVPCTVPQCSCEETNRNFECNDCNHTVTCSSNEDANEHFDCRWGCSIPNPEEEDYKCFCEKGEDQEYINTEEESCQLKTPSGYVTIDPELKEIARKLKLPLVITECEKTWYTEKHPLNK